MYRKNTASQKLEVFAFDYSTGAPLTGDAANITAYVNIDDAGYNALGDTSATEVDSTNKKGLYVFDLTQGETNGTKLAFFAKSSTANVSVLCRPPVSFTQPATGILAPATAGRTLVVDASGLADANMVKAGPTGSGTAQTTGDIFGAVGALNTSASSGDPGTTTTHTQYLKQIINTLEGSAGIPTFPSGAAPANNVSLAEAIRYIAASVPNAAAGASGGLLIAGLNAATTFSSIAVTNDLIVSGNVECNFFNIDSNIQIAGNLSVGNNLTISGAFVSTSASNDIRGIQVNDLTAAALAKYFSVNSGTTYASAVAGSVVKEIADNAGGGTPPTAAEIADAVWDEDATGHQTQGSFGQVIGDSGADTDSIWALAKTNLNAAVSTRAPSATALSTAQWTNARAGYLDNINNANLASVPAFPSNFASLSITAGGIVKADLQTILTTAITEGGAGRLANAFTTQYNVASPVFTAASVNQTGDSFVRIGATGSGLTSLAPASTALSTAQWTNTRAGYLDNLNVGGAVASQADITALNQSASRRIVLTVLDQFERPESSSSTFTVELRTYDGDGAAVNADSTPTITPTGIVSGDLSANLGAVSNPATGVYRATYTVASGATIEQIRFDASATISSSTFTISAYSQVVDEVSSTWTTTDASHLTAIFNKLPSKTYFTGTNNSDGDVQMDEATGNFPGSVGSIAGITFPGNFASLAIDGSGRVTVGAFLSSLDLTATMKASVNSEVDTALDTAVPGSPTANSVNERLKTLDDNYTAARGGYLDNINNSALQTISVSAVAAQITTDHGAGSYIRNTEPLDTAGTRAAVGLATANLDSQLGALSSQLTTLDAEVLALGSPMQSGSSVTLSATQPDYAPSKTGDAMALTSGERDTLAMAILALADAIENGETLKETLRVMRAAVAGKSDGFPGPGDVHFRNRADTHDVITAGVDADGNRSSVMLDVNY